ncbi:MAG TPA: helix-turn-helix transcriptional regulator [Candidatus Kapabacteria bacterium]|nr:helix-turn-helix transcriptional regulator [Candidatus Kapabacteria bacterium]
MNDKNYYCKVVGANIRYYRQKRGFTQEKLAVLINTRNEYVSLLEGGHKNVSIDVLFRISKALDVDAGKFLAMPKGKKK